MTDKPDGLLFRDTWWIGNWIISTSSRADFSDDLRWGQWCREVAQEALSGTFDGLRRLASLSMKPDVWERQIDRMIDDNKKWGNV